MSDIPEEVIEEIRAIEWRDRYDVREDTVHTGQILKSDVIVFNRNATLLLGSANVDYVAIVAREIHFHSADATSTIVVNTLQGRNGRDGANGRHGERNSPDGEDGGAGANGTDGAPAPTCYIYAENLTYGEDNGTDTPPVVVVANGGNGGSGGSGGRGGNGADGRNYYAGEQTVNGIIL